MIYNDERMCFAMTEKEKMLSGENYNPRSEQLLKRRYEARALIDRFNSIPSDANEERQEILESLLGSIGDGVWLEKPFRCNYGENITIGENTFINCDCYFSDDNLITIGKNVMIAPRVQLYGTLHPVPASERILDIPRSEHADHLPYRVSSKPIVIEDECWLGGGCIILPGVTIGKGSVIGAGSIVTKDIPPHSVAVGNPCRVIRTIDEE